MVEAKATMALGGATAGYVAARAAGIYCVGVLGRSVVGGLAGGPAGAIVGALVGLATLALFSRD